MRRQSAIIITECKLEIIIACGVVIIMHFSDYLRNCEGSNLKKQISGNGKIAHILHTYCHVNGAWIIAKILYIYFQVIYPSDIIRSKETYLLKKRVCFRSSLFHYHCWEALCCVFRKIISWVSKRNLFDCIIVKLSIFAAAWWLTPTVLSQYLCKQWATRFWRCMIDRAISCNYIIPVNVFIIASCIWFLQCCCCAITEPCAVWWVIDIVASFTSSK